MFRKFIRWVLKDDTQEVEYDPPVPCYNGNMTKSHHGPSLDDQAGFNFTVFSAVGGKVIRIHNYDPKTDRHNSTLYIITDKEDFGEELSHIITRDSLSR